MEEWQREGGQISDVQLILVPLMRVTVLGVPQRNSYYYNYFGSRQYCR